MRHTLHICCSGILIALMFVSSSAVHAAGGAVFSLNIEPVDTGPVNPPPVVVDPPDPPVVVDPPDPPVVVDPPDPPVVVDPPDPPVEQPPPRRRRSGGGGERANSFLVFNEVPSQVTDPTASAIRELDHPENVFSPLPDTVVRPVFTVDPSLDAGDPFRDSEEFIDVVRSGVPFTPGKISFLFAGGFVYSLKSISAVTILLTTQVSFFAAAARMIYIFFSRPNPFNIQYVPGRLLRVIILLLSVALFFTIVLFAGKNLIPTQGGVPTSIRIEQQLNAATSAVYRLFDRDGVPVFERQYDISSGNLRNGLYADIVFPLPETVSYGPHSLQISFLDGGEEYVSGKYHFILIPETLHAFFRTFALYPETERIGIPVNRRDILRSI